MRTDDIEANNRASTAVAVLLLLTLYLGIYHAPSTCGLQAGTNDSNGRKFR